MKKLAFFFISVVLLGLGACKKNNSHQTLLASANFPTTIGSWWQYKELDRNSNVIDTLNLTILDITHLGSVTYQRWVRTRSNSPYLDTVYVSNTDTSITFTPPVLEISFPIVENEPWASPPLAGVSYTTNTQNIAVNGSNYNGAVYLNQYQPVITGTGINESIWIVKNIGIVKHIVDDAGGLPYSDDELISYHVN